MNNNNNKSIITIIRVIIIVTIIIIITIIIVNKHVKENIIYDFKDKYVQAKRIYSHKGNTLCFSLQVCKRTHMKNSVSAFHCLAER